MSSAQYNVDRLIMSGRVALHYEDYVLSIQYFNQAISQKPFLWEPWQLRAVAKFYLDDYAGATEDASEAIYLNPYVSELYDLRAVCNIRQKNFDDAISDYDKAVRLVPDNRNYRYNRAVCHLEKKDYEACSTELDTVIMKWSKYAPAYLVKAEVSLLTHDTLKATEWIDRSLEIDAYNAEAWRVRANIALSAEDWKKADELYSKVVHLKPKNVPSYLNRAVARLKLNNLRGAMQDYDFALEFDPTNFLGHYNRGLLRQQVGDDNRAIEDFNFVLSLEPDNLMALLNRAMLLDQTGDLRGAIRDYSRIINEFPNFWTGLKYRAGCYRRLGMNAKAEQDEFRILKAQMDKHIGIQQRWSKKKLMETRKKSEVDLDKYASIVVEDEQENANVEYKSEYRGRIQNRHVDSDLQPFIVLSPLEYNNTVNSNKPFHQKVEEINLQLSRLYRSHIYLSALPHQLPPEKTAGMFAMTDTLTAMIHAARNERDAMQLFLARSVAYTVMQNYQDAIRDLDIYLGMDTTASFAMLQKAVCQARLMDYETAETPNERNMRSAGVIADFDKAIRMDPDNTYAVYCKGTYLAMRGDNAKALECFNACISKDNRFPEAYYNRGLINLRLGNKEKAIIDLGKAGEQGLYQAYSIIKENSKTDDNKTGKKKK